jgi:deoxyribodipyrimidine photo-lyase
VWFRDDLRTADNPALFDAMSRGEAVAVFCLCPMQWRSHDVGDNRLAFLLDTLRHLATDLHALGVPFRMIDEPTFDGVAHRLVRLATEVGASAITFNAEYPVDERTRDAQVAEASASAGLDLRVHQGGVVLPPGMVLTQDHRPFTVFSAFKRRWLARLEPSCWEPLPQPCRQTRPDVEDSPLPDQIDGVRLGPLARRWPGGQGEALRRLDQFVATRLDRYHLDRDLPAVDGTSALSPYLAVGSISARQCLGAAVAANDGRLAAGSPGPVAWINELIWRDFYRHVVAQFPHVSRGHAFRRAMDALPWRRAADELEAWKAGRTGYPLVDAAMRQLNETGWMHNRLRMVTAMFLSKHLLLDWRHGERHFMNLLVDGDFAANNGGWQWSAATGTDAAPYFRIFNPTTQAQRFDPDGVFVRRYVAELRDVPLAAVFEPARHGVAGYPRPIVEHAAARQRALDTFKSIR